MEETENSSAEAHLLRSAQLGNLAAREALELLGNAVPAGDVDILADHNLPRAVLAALSLKWGKRGVGVGDMSQSRDIAMQCSAVQDKKKASDPDVQCTR